MNTQRPAQKCRLLCVILALTLRLGTPQTHRVHSCWSIHDTNTTMLIRVMTFNINGSDFEIAPETEWRSWANRADLTLKTIRRYSPDLIGLQEVVAANVDFYREHLPGYGFELWQEYDESEYAGY